MSVATVSDFIYQTKEFWLNQGPPKAMYSEAGNLCMMLEKSASSRWTGDGIGKLAVKTALNGNVGPHFSKAYNSRSSTTGSKFNVLSRELWSFLRLSGKTIELMPEGAFVGGEGAITDSMEDSTAALMRAKSYQLWGDGTGRIGKGDGAYSVAGTEITFLNRQSVVQFEIGDVIRLIDQGAAVPASGQPTPRAGTLTVSGVNEDTGTITTSAAVNTIVGAVNTDFIGKDTAFESNSGLIDGVFRWVPLTKAEATTTLFDVDRSVHVSRLAGRRVEVGSGESAYQIVGKMGRQLKNARGGGFSAMDDYYLFVGSNEIESLTAEAAGQGIMFQDAKSTTDASNLVMGVEYVYAAWPGLGRMKIVVDHFLHNPAVTEKNDRTYAMLNMADWRIETGRTGITWKKYEDNGGYIKHASGSEDEYWAQYGFHGNLICDRPGFQVVAGTTSG